MKQPNITLQKSFDFAIRVVHLYQYLKDYKKEFVISKQLLRSGTSVGANIREAYNAESDRDFIHKFGIAQKECDETAYWLELLKATDILTQQEFESIYVDCQVLLKIIKSIILTKKQNMK
ncbi:MAG: four helix bundle protein [Runella slithyformis]|nr:MAG: four helix bundle protein [Runella slithyformis]TAF28309.1 MAG: four helix bundle protein [Runella slithyformis]TAF49733.1 MAG: four helix bundle protein [Runella slithyformis]TAF81909.1 MAG: four helix bundle protein [Runella slithyformis]